MTNYSTNTEAESTEAAQLAQYAIDAALEVIEAHQDVYGPCEAPFRLVVNVDNGNEADREVSGPHDEANEALQRAAEAHDRYTGRNGWIRHDGGECPVQAMDVVEVCLRSGKTNPAEVAHRWYWPHVEITCDITHYRHLRDPDGIPYCSAEGLEDWAEYVVTDEDGEGFQFRSRPSLEKVSWQSDDYILALAPNRFANTHDHWTQTLRRVWRPEAQHG